MLPGCLYKRHQPLMLRVLLDVQKQHLHDVIPMLDMTMATVLRYTVCIVLIRHCYTV